MPSAQTSSSRPRLAGMGLWQLEQTEDVKQDNWAKSCCVALESLRFSGYSQKPVQSTSCLSTVLADLTKSELVVRDWNNGSSYCKLTEKRSRERRQRNWRKDAQQGSNGWNFRGCRQEESCQEGRNIADNVLLCWPTKCPLFPILAAVQLERVFFFFFP